RFSRDWSSDVCSSDLDYYHQTLKQEPEVQEYLSKRGLDDAELINHFKLGYANRTLGLRLPQKNRKAGNQIREQLQRIGLYRDTRSEERRVGKEWRTRD